MYTLTNLVQEIKSPVNETDELMVSLLHYVLGNIFSAMASKSEMLHKLKPVMTKADYNLLRQRTTLLNFSQDDVVFSKYSEQLKELTELQEYVWDDYWSKSEFFKQSEKDVFVKIAEYEEKNALKHFD